MTGYVPPTAYLPYACNLEPKTKAYRTIKNQIEPLLHPIQQRNIDFFLNPPPRASHAHATQPVHVVCM
jgi:hypothetical protein